MIGRLASIDAELRSGGGMNYWKAQTLMASARFPHKGKPIGNNTRLYDNDGYYTIRLHNNVIMEIHRDGFFPMDAGWQPVTTKARLNEHMEVGHIHQRDFTWYYTIGDTEYLWSDVYFVSMHLLPHQYPPKTQVMSQSEYRAWKETWEVEE